MTIDIHQIITGNPISKNLMKPWGSNSKPNSLRGKLFNRYTGLGNPVQQQVDFNPYTGQIYKVYDPPSSKNDRCSMIHDIMYTVAENIGRDSKDIKNRKLDADKEWLDCFKPRSPYDMLAYSAIKIKKTLGLGNDFTMNDLSEKLNKPQFNNSLDKGFIKYKLTDSKKRMNIQKGDGIGSLLSMAFNMIKPAPPKIASTIGLSGLLAGVSHGINKALNKKKILEIDEKTMNQIRENLKKINDSKVFDRKITLNQKGSGIFSFLLPMLASTIIPSLISGKGVSKNRNFF